MSLTDYIPHGLVASFATVIGYVFNAHVKADKERFAQLTEDHNTLDAKLDSHFLAMSDQLTRIALAVGARKSD
jgi:hypothetical protein